MKAQGQELRYGTPHEASDDRASQRYEIEMSFIRTLSVRGLVLGGPSSAVDRRERIRVSILAEKLAGRSFAENMSFAQAYKRCYNRPLNLRRVARDRHQRPLDLSVPFEDDVFLDGDESDDTL